MILKEISFDLPYIEDKKCIARIQGNEGLDYEEARIKEYNQNWKWKRRAFSLQTRCMTSMIERLMPRIVTDNYWKILINCAENPIDKVLVSGGVFEMWIEFNYCQFQNFTTLQKKQYVIEKVIEAMNQISSHVDFDVDIIVNICNTIRQMNYQNQWFWGKPKRNKSKFAQIEVVHDVENVQIFMNYLDSQKNVIKRTLLLTEKPDEWAYGMCLGKIVWVNDDEAQLISRDGNKKWGP